jgi:nicotinamide mononucleotide transporter
LTDGVSPGGTVPALGDALAAGLQALSAWEAVAVLLALAYLVGVIRQHVLAWPAALASAGIYLVLMFEAKLYMQSVLQLFYAGLAVYGWWHWRAGDRRGGLPVRRWGWRQHVSVLCVIAVSGSIVGWFSAQATDAAFPYLDAWVACGAVVTTAMVARKILENWHYWFVIDSASIYLYASQGLWLTVGLFLVYLVLVVIGYREWRGTLEAHG